MVERPIKISGLKDGEVDLGNYDYYMQKEIFEQPQSIRDSLESRINNNSVLVSTFGYNAKNIFSEI